MKRKWFLRISLPLIAFVVVFTSSGITHADPFARGRWYGYFHNRLETSGADLIPGGIYVGDVQSFLNFYWNALYSANVQYRVSAEFTILTMLGYPAGTGWQVARNQFAEWERTVRWYAANGRISWGAMYSYSFNTYYQRASADVAWYVEPDTRDSIVFYNPNGTTYAIKKDCANPVGDMTPLQIPPPPPPPTVVSCGDLIVNPSSPEVGQPISVTARPRYSGGPPGPPTITNNSITVLNSPGVVGHSVSVAGGTVSMASVPFTVGSSGVYSVRWVIKINEAPVITCGGTFNLSFDSFEVSNYPFLRVIGGDVAAGSSFDVPGGQSCGSAQANTNGGIASWNRNSPTWLGAGGQYGLYARSQIQGILSNWNNGWPDPAALSFANRDVGGRDSVNTSSSRYGGYFASGPCADYWDDRPTTPRQVPNPTNASLNGLSGIYMHTGNLEINPSLIGAGTKLTIYVDGNVSIRGDITYGNNPSWANTAQIPALKIIAFGSIHINSTVNTIDGTYIAIPDNGYWNRVNSYAAPQRGTISTCSSGFNVRRPDLAPIGPMISGCNRQLTVNGSLIANQLFLLRTNGTMSSNQPAEIINFGPEMWLAPSDNATIDPAYQSIIGLPPVL